MNDLQQKAYASATEVMKANDALYADLAELGAEYRGLMSSVYNIQLALEKVQASIKEKIAPKQLNG